MGCNNYFASFFSFFATKGPAAKQLGFCPRLAEGAVPLLAEERPNHLQAPQTTTMLKDL
jgi:hypothetical protein